MTDSAYTSWAPFAMHGIEMEVPDEWDLGAMEGDFRKGYMRLDDAQSVRMEVRWERGRRTGSVERMVSAQILQLERAAKKLKLPFRARRKLAMVSPREGREAECYEWVSDYRAYDMLTRCERCRRVVLLRVFTRPKESLKPIIRRIFESFRDHPEGEEQLWALYGFRCRAPKRYHLEEADLKAGKIELVLRAGGESLVAARYGVAKILLRAKDLETWFRCQYERHLRPWRLMPASAVVVQGHDALQFIGQPRLRLSLRALFQKRAEFRATVWHCETSDKIYVAQISSPTPADPAEFERFLRSFTCH